MMAESALLAPSSPPTSPFSNATSTDAPPKVTYYEEEEDEEELDEKSIEAVKPWDEGGASDCGYSEPVHATLMSLGAGVHTVLGHPGQQLGALQKSVGNWFQELSYATRDICRGGSSGMQQDAANAIKTVMTGTLAEEDEEDEYENYNSSQNESAIGGGERKEDPPAR